MALVLQVNYYFVQNVLICILQIPRLFMYFNNGLLNTVNRYMLFFVLKVLNAERISFIGGQHPPVPACARIQMQKARAVFQRQKPAAASMDSF